ncbi:MAG TPA: tRNA (N6-threonylcarbamoyladenosine(37)-N6)-methyltransferase TrmO [Alphaproteobacteria bacterium]|jgi:tRNA-Thr(GGU) m(6)t(6)A37 methyltransferase TsaA|nr:tRNA (N6-threonylcarbamoyladenosine(37)-N6)-methyltransferase TrmO [Alphaproteobacteria bacterium]|tara:strand:- start:290 stop:691 length:402 start_codon:yes stop_codon:yes gene_type:complete
MDTATIRFIGEIRTSYKTVAECPGQARPNNGVSRIIVDPAMVSALKGIENNSRIQVLYWFDEADRSVLQTVPRWSETKEKLGVFALRSPMRPNPIALSTVELLKVEGNELTVSALDCRDGTPLLDIKSYIDQP